MSYWEIIPAEKAVKKHRRPPRRVEPLTRSQKEWAYGLAKWVLLNTPDVRVEHIEVDKPELLASKGPAEWFLSSPVQQEAMRKIRANMAIPSA